MVSNLIDQFIGEQNELDKQVFVVLPAGGCNLIGFKIILWTLDTRHSFYSV